MSVMREEELFVSKDLPVGGYVVTGEVGYYTYPEALMVVECASRNCSFVWDFPYLAGIDENAPHGLVYEPMRPGDESCPKCGTLGKDTSRYPFPLSSEYTNLVAVA